MHINCCSAPPPSVISVVKQWTALMPLHKLKKPLGNQVLMQRHGARCLSLHSPCFRRYADRVNTSVVDHIFLAHLRDLATTRTGICAEPGYPTTRASKGALGVIDGKRGRQDDLLFLGRERFALSGLHLTRHSNLHASERVAGDQPLIHRPREHRPCGIDPHVGNSSRRSLRSYEPSCPIACFVFGDRRCTASAKLIPQVHEHPAPAINGAI